MKYILIFSLLIALGLGSCNRDCGTFTISGTFYSKVDSMPIANTAYVVSYTYRQKVNGKLYQNNTEFSTDLFGKWSHTGITQCITTYELKTKSGTTLYTSNKVGNLGNFYITP